MPLIYKTKRIRLYKGECLKVMRKFPDDYFDMILTDMPYGTTTCKWDIIIPLEPMWEQVKRIAKDNAAIILFGSEPFSSTLRMSNIDEYKYDWIWNKIQGFGMSTSKILPLKSHEVISVFGEGKILYNPQMINRKKELNTKNWKQDKRNSENGNFSSKDNSLVRKIYKEKFPTTILEYHKSAKECNHTKRLHPTQKPVALMEYLIKTYTNENQRILDFTMGSGTTGVACIHLNRKFIGIEKEQKYCDIAINRIKNAKLSRKSLI